MKKLYNWVLKWANSPNSVVALFILAFCESVFFPVPPDILLIALVLGYPARAFRFALVCTAGSVTGAFAGYALGSLLWLNKAGEFTLFAQFFLNNIPGFSIEVYNNIRNLFNTYDFWVIFTAGFTPIPYKVFTVTAGAFDINLFMFFIASMISRGARFFLLAGLIWKCGPGIKTFIDRYFNWVAFGFTICLLGVVLFINYLI